ncbi:retention module-containing protein [Marinomonas balearica]|uniref:Bacterial Ig-like domain-containing protein n=1 Tax=Marinomonas balearica TaxID=491947 RepID=A0A4R6MH62_9GAMM|nr:retention module-containing protein [Marinomonas balearica]TDP01268.1 hypothetical protein DFP79_0170 [Marinomonas balearica]
MDNNQTTFATLGKAIGYAKQVSGNVEVHSIDGQVRMLEIKDSIFYAESIIAVGNGSATIVFDDGTELFIDNQSTVEINDSVYHFDNDVVDNENTGVDTDTVSEEALQQAILAGQDPTLIQDAPAAGDSLINSEESPVYVSIDSEYVINTPTFGYDTDNFNPILISSGNDDTDIGESRTYSASSNTSETITGTSIPQGTDTGGTNTPPIEPTTDLQPSSDEFDTYSASIDVNLITSDKTISSDESAPEQTVAISGWVSGDAQPGDTVTISLENNVIGETAVSEEQDEQGRYLFNVEVLGSTLAQTSLENPFITATVSNTSKTGSASSTEIYKVDYDASNIYSASIDVNLITSDKIISSVESAPEQTVSISGWVSGDAQPGDSVAISLENNVIGEAAVSEEQDEQGRYLFNVKVLGSTLAQTSLESPFITATVSDASETGSASSTEIYKIDLYADIEVFIDEANGNQQIDFDEQESVKVGGWIESGGDVLSIEISDESGNAINISDAITLEEESGWSYFESNIDMSALSDGTLSVIVSATDAAGNSSVSETLQIDKNTNQDSDILSERSELNTMLDSTLSAANSDYFTSDFGYAIQIDG